MIGPNLTSDPFLKAANLWLKPEDQLEHPKHPGADRWRHRLQIQVRIKPQKLLEWAEVIGAEKMEKKPNIWSNKEGAVSLWRFLLLGRLLSIKNKLDRVALYEFILVNFQLSG